MVVVKIYSDSPQGLTVAAIGKWDRWVFISARENQIMMCVVGIEDLGSPLDDVSYYLIDILLGQQDYTDHLVSHFIAKFPFTYWVSVGGRRVGMVFISFFFNAVIVGDSSQLRGPSHSAPPVIVAPGGHVTQIYFPLVL